MQMHHDNEASIDTEQNLLICHWSPTLWNTLTAVVDHQDGQGSPPSPWSACIVNDGIQFSSEVLAHRISIPVKILSYR